MASGSLELNTSNAGYTDYVRSSRGVSGLSVSGWVKSKGVLSQE